jgi:hypothetical protein
MRTSSVRRCGSRASHNSSVRTAVRTSKLRSCRKGRTESIGGASVKRGVGVDFLAGAKWDTESERILLRQIGWMRRMLSRTVHVYGGGDKWLTGHLITLREAVSKKHPILKRFYMDGLTVKDIQKTGDDHYEACSECIWDSLDTVGYKTSGDLAEEVGINSSSVRKVIERMVAEGHPIVATKEGYKRAQSQGELLSYQRGLLDRADAIMKRAIAVGKIAHDFERGWR